MPRRVSTQQAGEPNATLFNLKHLKAVMFGQTLDVGQIVNLRPIVNRPAAVTNRRAGCHPAPQRSHNKGLTGCMKNHVALRIRACRVETFLDTSSSAAGPSVGITAAAR